MTAAPYKVNLTVKKSSGQTKSIYLTASDVNAAALVFPSGGTELQLSADNCWIADFLYSAAGTDTTNSTLFINGIDSGIKIIHGVNLGTQYSRQFMQAPVMIPAGALVKIVQNT